MEVAKYLLRDDGTFPNSGLPVLHYRQALHIPTVLGGFSVRRLFYRNNWRNNWRSGIYTYHHYHSVTHEVMGVVKGRTTLLLGGAHGAAVTIAKGDVLLIPAGVAHKNLGGENDVVCIGGYPGGAEYDMNYGKPGERPGTDRNIARVPLPETDPVTGTAGILLQAWRQ